MFQLSLTSSVFVLEQLEGFPPHRRIPNNLLDCSMGIKFGQQCMIFTSELYLVITQV